MVLKPQDVAHELGISPSTLRLWSSRFADLLSDQARKLSSDGSGAAQRRYVEGDVSLLLRAKELLGQGLTYEEVSRRLGGAGLQRPPASEQPVQEYATPRRPVETAPPAGYSQTSSLPAAPPPALSHSRPDYAAPYAQHDPIPAPPIDYSAQTYTAAGQPYRAPEMPAGASYASPSFRPAEPAPLTDLRGVPGAAAASQGTREVAEAREATIAALSQSIASLDGYIRAVLEEMREVRAREKQLRKEVDRLRGDLQQLTQQVDEQMRDQRRKRPWWKRLFSDIEAPAPQPLPTSRYRQRYRSDNA